MVLLDRVRAFAQRHDIWRPNTRVVVALSGGSDSVAMLLLLRDLTAAGELVLDSAAHLNHRIRGAEADQDEGFCRTLCERLGVPIVTAQIDVPARARAEGQSLEVAARRARQEFLAGVRRSRSADVVATAHTEDDQAETILLRLVRGTGGRGLAGIAPRREHVIRPVLTCTRGELRAELDMRQQEWREDATNAEVANPRNRVRHELLPYLAEHFNPSVTRALARLADVARADESWLEAMAENVSREIVRLENDIVSVNVSGLRGLPEGLARRVARHALKTANPGRSYGVQEVDLVLAIAAGRRTAAEISGLRVERFRDSAVLLKRRPQARPRRRGMGLGASRP